MVMRGAENVSMMFVYPTGESETNNEFRGIFSMCCLWYNNKYNYNFIMAAMSGTGTCKNTQSNVLSPNESE